jgi:hypothetical protein
MTSKWPSIKDGKKPSKTNVYYDKHMEKYVPLVKKAQSKKVKSRLAKLKIKQA